MTQESKTKAGRQNTSSSGSQSAMDTAADTVRDVAGQAKDAAGQIADQARQQATSQLSSQKTRAAEGLGSVAQALRQTSQQLQGQDQGAITSYIDQAASQVDRFSNYLQQKDVRQMADDVERFARRQPALFLGGAFVLGLLGARFLKSSSPQQASMGSYPITSRRDYSYTGGTYGQTYGQGYERAVGSGPRTYSTSAGTGETVRYGSAAGDAYSSTSTTAENRSTSGSAAGRRTTPGSEEK
jgi:hypothetical protein